MKNYEITVHNINIYGPNKDNPSFYSKIEEIINELTMQRLEPSNKSRNLCKYK